MLKIKRLIIIFTGLLLVVPCAAVEIIFVDADAVGANNGLSWANAYTSLQDGIADADSLGLPAEIRVAEGIYKPDQGAGITPGDRSAAFGLINDVIIKGGYAGFGEPDPDARDTDVYETILSGDLNGNDAQVSDPCELLDEPTRSENSYHVVDASGTDPSAVLDGFSITAGNANGSGTNLYGGGIYTYSGSPILLNCTFSSNSASYGGGGMDIESSSSTLTDCTFNDNLADYGGGGLCIANSSDPTLTNCTFSGNVAKNSGGGLGIAYDCDPMLTNCTFVDNTARSNGGGMDNYNSNPTLTNCTFSNNSTEGFGGGLDNYNSGSTLNNCTFSGNTAEGSGGGIDNYSATLWLTGCIINGNKAKNTGGGINGQESVLFITNCTISKNTAYGPGGAYQGDYTDATIKNCILWDNTAGIGDEIALYNFTAYSALTTVSYSDVKGGSAAIYVEPNSTLIWYPGNIDADPCFVEPGYWDANGTPEDANDDIWVDGDYHLKSFGWQWDRDANEWGWDDVTSRCIDAGNPGSELGDEPITLDVAPFNRLGQNLRINMGAFGGTAEASMPPYDWAILGDSDNDGTVDFKDFAYMASDWLATGNEKPADLDRNGIVDLDDLDLLMKDWLKQTTWHEP